MLDFKTSTYKRKNLIQNINEWRKAIILEAENWELSNNPRVISSTFTDWGGLCLFRIVGIPIPRLRISISSTPLSLGELLTNNYRYDKCFTC